MNEAIQQMIVVVCMDTTTGKPAVHLSRILATQEEIDQGLHLNKAIEDSKEFGYGEPFICFDESTHFIITEIAEELRSYSKNSVDFRKMAVVLKGGRVVEVLYNHPIRVLALNADDVDDLEIIEPNHKRCNSIDIDELFGDWDCFRSQVSSSVLTKH